jgi:hypothetical protein
MQSAISCMTFGSDPEGSGRRKNRSQPTRLNHSRKAGSSKPPGRSLSAFDRLQDRDSDIDVDFGHGPRPSCGEQGRANMSLPSAVSASVLAMV